MFRRLTLALLLAAAVAQAQEVDSAKPASPRTAKAGPAAKSAARVTGIRHWSTANYTRVAIDLGDEVSYEAARVEHPDRIFFDLHHAHLAPELVGKSFAVTDDGFLSKIRAAQYTDDITRVVLDVNGGSEYSAFLLPNPYRLIIDIHGKAAHAAAATFPATVKENTPGAPSATGPSSRTGSHHLDIPTAPAVPADTTISHLPPMEVTDGSASFGLPAKSEEGTTRKTSAAVAPPRVVIPTRSTTAKPVPNTVTTRQPSTAADVAAVSDQPGKVEATTRPTTSPVVSGTRSPKPLRSEDTQPPTEVAAATPSTKSKPSKNRKSPIAASPVDAAPPTANGETLLRALGLKIGRIVIDAGHGGHDSGTLGAGGIQEKDIVLDVALRLGKLLHQRLGAEIVYTRADDTFIPLETRTAIANKAQADLFISVHANSSADPSARGVEVYYLNFTSDPEAMKTAARENAVSTQSVHELSDLVKKIALKDKLDESQELAADVDTSLFAGLTRGNTGLKNRGVKKAPFVVLIGANMPSILAEISFVTNPNHATQLQTPGYRQRVAESLYTGVAQYAATVNGAKPTTTTAHR